ncbi:MAG: hypothetical protein FIA91_07595 [Geobacter sp.]|nr:hypothetical protein [Geobacter sp.]
MDRTKLICLISGAVAIICGYWLLAVPVACSYEEVLLRAKSGTLTVIIGGAVLLGGIMHRS